MDGGDQVNPLPHIGAVVNTNIQPLFRKLFIDHPAPCFPPFFQRFRAAPVGSGYGVEHGLAVPIQHPVSLIIQHIFPALLLSPCAVWIDGAHGRHHMDVRVGDASVLLVRGMDGKIGNHSFVHQTALHKLPRQRNVFFHRKFILQSNIKAVSKLRFLVFLYLFHRIPQGRPVLVFQRGMGRQQNFGTDHAALAGVVTVLAVVITVKTLPGPVSCGGNGALSGAASDLADR